MRPRVLLALLGVLAGQGSAAQVAVLTYHNDNSRTGQNTHETALTPANVHTAQFGKLFSRALDGDVYAQPLYFQGVVFVVTEANSVYALDAGNGAVLWRVGFGAPISATDDLGCAAISPQVGITATPVIDPVRRTLYVEAFSKENGALIHRLHALDIATGADRGASPVTAPGFDPTHQLGRAGLLLADDTVYVAYGSHCDKPRFQGWIFAYDAATLAPEGAFATTREHGKAAIWMSGAAPAADERGNVFVATGDGWFAPPADLGNSILKLSPRLSLLDYFTPFNQASLARHDGDLGSGGVLLLPEDELLQVGKGGTVYLLNRNTLTAGNQHYCAGCGSNRQIAQELPEAIAGGVWGMPAYWHETVYISGSGDPVRAFPLRQGRLQPTPGGETKDPCGYPGCGLSISANGTHDGILWALEVGDYDTKGPAVLRAYDALDLGRLLYAEAAGGAVRFTLPTVVNGRVYVGGAGQLSVFGLRRRLD